MSLSELILDKRKGYLTSRVESIKVDNGMSLLSGSDSVTLNASVGTGSYNVFLPTVQGSAGDTLVNDGSGNLSWNASGGGGHSTGTITVYQNFTSGNDANDGTIASPVKTLQAAIYKLAESSAQEAKIIMQDTVNDTIVSNTVPGVFNESLNNDLANVLDFSSLSGKYSRVEVEHGAPVFIVLNTGTIGTWFSDWITITNAGAGFTPNEFRSMVAYNIDQDKYYGVASNTTTDVNLVSGEITPGDNVFIVDFSSYNPIIRPVSGNDLVINSQIPVEFRYCSFSWTAADPKEGYLRNIGAAKPKFEACYFEFITNPGRILGSFDYNGCGAFGAVTAYDNKFTNSDFVDCSFIGDQGIASNTTSINNLYVYNGTLELGRCSAEINGLYLDNFGLNKMNYNTLDQSFVTINICEVLSNYNGSTIRVDQSSSLSLNVAVITNTNQSCLNVIEGSMLTLNGNCTLTANGIGITVQESSLNLLEGNISITSTTDGAVSLFGGKLLRSGANLTLNALFSGLFLGYGSEWSTNYTGNISCNTGGTAIVLRKGSRLSTSATVTQAGGGGVFQCGGNVVGAFVKQNDLMAVIPEYCFAFID